MGTSMSTAGRIRCSRKLCAVIGRPDLGLDERFRDVAGRLRAADELEASVSAWMASRTVGEASEALAEAGIPFGPVATVADAVGSDQIAAREMLVEIEHPTLGPVLVTGIPVKLSATPGTVRKAPPRSARTTTGSTAPCSG